MSFFGLTEHYDVSLCLLRHTFATLSEDERAACACSAAGGPNNATATPVVGKLKIKQLPGMSTEAMHELAESTRLDDILYAKALGIFLRRVRKMEADIGRRVLCLEQWSPAEYPLEDDEYT